jgi:putative membrane protein
MRKGSAASAILVAVVIAVLLAALHGATAQQDQNKNSNMNQNSNMNSNTKASKGTTTKASTSPDQKFMMEAATAGMEEVELGRMAATKGSTDAVKQFGQRMVDDHSKANEELMQIASTKGVTLPTALDDKHKADIDKMSKLSGADFDRAYIKEAGVKDHDKAVKLFQGESTKGKDADVKAFADKTLPTVQEHLRMARDLDNSMNVAKGTAGGNSNMAGNSNMSGNTNRSGDRSKSKNKNKNSNMSNSNMSNSNMSNSNMSNSNMSENSNTSNSNGNSNNPR